MADYPQRLKELEPFWHEWKLDAPLGKGSYGKVYRIYHEVLGERYWAAMKWIELPASPSEVDSLRVDGLSDASISAYYDEHVRDMQSEIKLMDALRGTSNVVSFEDCSFIRRKEEIGWDILIRMELLTPLPQRLREGMTVGDVTRMGIDLCDALILCAREKIVHRDIKPDNIFISRTGNYKLGDFGVARRIRDDVTNLSMKGTPIYMAPELAKGEQGDQSVDQYSLGLVLHRLLNAQQIPFAPTFDRLLLPAEREEAFAARLKGEAIPLPLQGSRQLQEAVCRACSYQPGERFASPEEFRAALTEALNAMTEQEQNEPLMSVGTGPRMDSGSMSMSRSGSNRRTRSRSAAYTQDTPESGSVSDNPVAPDTAAAPDHAGIPDQRGGSGSDDMPGTADIPTPPADLSAPYAPGAPIQPRPSISDEKPRKKSGKERGLLIALIVVIIVAASVLAGAIMVLRNRPVPAAAPVAADTAVPTATPVPEPTDTPTPDPTAVPTDTPTASPTATPEPTNPPTASPTATPSPTPTATPTAEPTATPTPSPTPTATPTAVPTAVPPVVSLRQSDVTAQRAIYALYQLNYLSDADHSEFDEACWLAYEDFCARNGIDPGEGMDADTFALLTQGRPIPAPTAIPTASPEPTAAPTATPTLQPVALDAPEAESIEAVSIDSPTEVPENVVLITSDDPARRLNLRKKATANSTSLGKYYASTPVTLLGEPKNGWVQVQIGGTVSGYVQTKFLAMDGEEVPNHMLTRTIANAGGTGLHLRETPSTSAPSLGLYDNGTQVTVMGIYGDWAHVMVDGKIGFMLADKFDSKWGMTYKAPGTER